MAANAATDTYTDGNGITWTFQPGAERADGTTAATLGGGSETTTAMPTGTSLNAANIPWMFTKDGTDYTVTTTGLSTIWGKPDVNMFTGVSGCRIFVPTGSNWDTETDDEKGLAAYEANNTIFYYGAGRELDMSFDNDNKVVTATPATAHAFTNVLAAATIFKGNFGMDTRINVTNAIEIAAGSVTAEELAGVTFDSLTFAVKTQAQLDTVLAAVPAETPLAIDPEGAKETLTVSTANRKIYVMLPTNGTYWVRERGLIISFH